MSSEVSQVVKPSEASLEQEMEVLINQKPPSGGFLHSFYYLLKPLLPLPARYALRRLRASYKLINCRDWPIMEAANRPPRDWSGWPEGKQFAVVLTHDVEGPRGVERTPQLMRVESQRGFRSSFNFVPEGDYRVSGSLRQQLARDGFEVGVHDWKHDGTLFRSRQSFSQGAKRINYYLEEWGAAGFRAGFMFHNLDWISELNIQYDASTFDTDPFEPQPDGVNTIFPFWIQPRRERPGFVELPYTLPQDSTMFLILREKTIAIWKRKVDWVAAHGGMVLLNLHPDYCLTGGGSTRVSEFAMELYAQLLDYLTERYTGAFWHALPREVAAFYRQRRRLRGKSPENR